MYRHGINLVARNQQSSVACLRTFERYVSRASAVTRGLVAERRQPARSAGAGRGRDERRPSPVALSLRGRNIADRGSSNSRSAEKRDSVYDDDAAPAAEGNYPRSSARSRQQGAPGRERPSSDRKDRLDRNRFSGARSSTRPEHDGFEPRRRAPRSREDEDGGEEESEPRRRSSSIVPDRRRFADEEDSRPQRSDRPPRDFGFRADRSYGAEHSPRSRDQSREYTPRRRDFERPTSDARSPRRDSERNGRESDRGGFRSRLNDERDYRKSPLGSREPRDRSRDDVVDEGFQSQRRTGPLGFSRDDWAGPRSDGYERPKTKMSEYGSLDNDPPPGGIPFTTAESEFLYGANSVVAALKAKRRKSFALYLHPQCRQFEELKTLAREASVKVTQVGNVWKPYMEKRSEGRPHNGVLLEASPLPTPTIENLAKAKFSTSSFDTTPATAPIEHVSARERPLVLCLTDILDPQNLGSVLRTAYFLGIDAVIIDKRTCAPLGATALKASAGAAEALPIFFTNNARAFLANSRKFAWKVFAAHTPALKPPKDQQSPSASSLCDIVLHRTAHKGVMLTGEELVVQAPVILVVGGEGKGLQGPILGQTHGFMHIKSGRDTHAIGLDSLNVGVATAICCTDLLGRSLRTGDKTSQKTDLEHGLEDEETMSDSIESGDEKASAKAKVKTEEEAKL